MTGGLLGNNCLFDPVCVFLDNILLKQLSIINRYVGTFHSYDLNNL